MIMGFWSKYDVDGHYFIFALRILEIMSCRTSSLLLRYHVPQLYFVCNHLIYLLVTELYIPDSRLYDSTLSLSSSLAMSWYTLVPGGAFCDTVARNGRGTLTNLGSSSFTSVNLIFTGCSILPVIRNIK